MMCEYLCLSTPEINSRCCDTDGVLLGCSVTIKFKSVSSVCQSTALHVKLCVLKCWSGLFFLILLLFHKVIACLTRPLQMFRERRNKTFLGHVCREEMLLCQMMDYNTQLT